MMIDTEKFYNSLISSGFDFFAGVPDSLLKELCSCITDKTPSERHVITANEGNAVAMCAGYHMASGKYGVTYMQNSGQGNAVNPLASLTDSDVYSIPLLLIIGWRGEPGVHDEPQHVKQGKITLGLLDVLGIEYSILDDDYESAISKAISSMKSDKPYAIIVRKDTFSKYASPKIQSDYTMTREDALESIISCLGKDDMIVSTTGKTSREIFEIREKRGESHENDFLTVGSMGHTASIAYGMALGTDRDVFCIDGDGSMLMHMGGLAVIGTSLLPNFKYIVNDNSSHESVGGQPTCTGKLDLVSILSGFGFKKIVTVDSKEGISDAIAESKSETGVAIVLKTKTGSRSDLGRPTTAPVENKESLMKKMGL